MVPVLSCIHFAGEEPESRLLTCMKLAMSLECTGQCSPGLLSYSVGGFRLRGLPWDCRRAFQAEDSVKFGGGQFHLRSGFSQTRCRALGIEAVFLKVWANEAGDGGVELSKR